ncbi:hypothetical protein Tco_0348731 [Tanacetum coccineum]
MSNHATNWDKANNESKIVNESLTAELERYKERVKILEQRFNVDSSSHEKFIDSQMDDIIRMKNTKFAAFETEIDILKQTLSKHVKEKESLLTTLNGFKMEFKERESKSIDKEIVLENKNKELENIVCLHDEITEVQTVFTQMEAAVEQCSVDRKSEVVKKNDVYIELLKWFSNLEQHCISLEVAKKLNKETFQKDKSSDNQNHPEIQEYFEQNDLKARLQAKDTVISKLKETIHSLRENVNPAKVKKDIDEIETINIELEHSVAKLLSKNEKLHKEKEHLKKTYKELYDSIKPSRVHAKEQCDSLIANLNYKSMENVDLKTKIQEKCPLTRFTSTKVVPLKETTTKLVLTPTQGIVVYSRRPKATKSVGSSSKSKIIESRSYNQSETTQTGEFTISNVPSSSLINCRLSKLFCGIWTPDTSKHMIGNRSQLTNFVNKFLGTVKFGNDHIAKIIGYGDYQIGNVTISRVYYIEAQSPRQAKPGPR